MFRFFPPKSMSDFKIEDDQVSFAFTLHAVLSVGALGVIIFYNYLRRRRNEERLTIDIRP